MDPNFLNNFLFSYIYNLNKDKLDELEKNQKDAASASASAANAEVANSKIDYLSDFYKYLDVMCKICDIPPIVSSSYTYKLSDYIALFKKLNSTIISYNIMSKIPLFNLNFYYISMHGGYDFQLEIIKTVPQNFVIIFTAPINYYVYGLPVSHLEGIKEAVKSLKNYKNIACLAKLDKYKNFEVLLPYQKYYDIELEYDHSKNSDKCMNLYCLNGDNPFITKLCMLPKDKTTLSNLLERPELKKAASENLVYLFVTACRSLNYEIIQKKLSGQNAKIPNILDISTQMYIYHNFMYYYNYNMLNCISSDISNSSFENKSGHIYKHIKYLSTEDTINYLLKNAQNRKSFNEMIKSYILEKYNREYPALHRITTDNLSVFVNKTILVRIHNLSGLNDYSTEKDEIEDILNSYIQDLTKDNSHALEHFLRMASFGNVGNSSLGTRGKITMEEAIVFAFTEFEPPPPEIQSHPLFEKLKDNPIYQNLKDIIKSMPLFSNLNRLGSTKYLSSLGSGDESNGSNEQAGGMYRKKVFKRKTCKRHSILQPNRYHSKSSKRRLPQYFK